MLKAFGRRSVLAASAFGSILLAFAGPGTASTQALPKSGEFQVNTYTQLNQSTPAIAADSQGSFVVVWEQLDLAGPDNIVARRFDSSGNGVGADFQVNVFTAGVQRSPAVGRSAAGGFVVVWASNGQDGDSYGVFGRRYDAAGNALATEFQINSYTTSMQTAPRVAMGSGGDFIVVWGSNGQDGNGSGVFGRRFDSAGGALGAEFQVNTYITLNQGAPNVARKSDGSFVVSWNSYGQDGDLNGAFGRRFDSGGSSLGGELQINAYTIGQQAIPTIVHAGDGFVAAWQSQNQDGSGFGIFARGFDGDGVGEDAETQINTFTTDDQFQPVVLTLADRNFIVVWYGDSQDGDSYGIFARVFDQRSDQVGDEIQLNTTVVNQQRFPRAVATGQHFVVVWQSLGQDGSNSGIFGRRFVVPITLDVDGDGQVLPLTDSLLILRYTFGFRGSTLITGAVNPSCTRCDAPAIESYLGSV